MSSSYRAEDSVALRSGAAVKCLAELGEITTSPTRVRFQGGDYEHFYFKPGQTLSTALLTSRELLVAVTAFRDLQARTLMYVEERLRQGLGRLEPAIAIIFHADPDADVMLRQWGAERGLTVLPVYGERPNDYTTAHTQESMSEGLYAHDPFDVAGPVRNASQFFGRGQTADMARRLRGGHVQSLFGIRKIGKTSVLNRVLDEARSHHGVACVMVDCSDDGLCGLSAGKLLNSIAGGVNEAANFAPNGYSSVIPLDSEIDCAEAARVLLQLLEGVTRPVAILLDEVDYITPGSPTSDHWRREFNTFFRALRTVYQETCRTGVAFSVVVCGVSSYWFTLESVGGVENSSLAFVPDTYLPPLERSASIEMVQTLGRTAGLAFDNAASDRIAATCSDMPFWIRKLGSFVNSCFAIADRPLELSLSDVAILCDEFIDVEGSNLAYASLRHLFRVHPAVGDAAYAIATGDTRSVSEHLVSVIGRYGILGSGIDPSGPMVASALRRWEEDRHSAKPEDVTGPRGAEATGPSTPTEADWETLIAEVSALRNALERDLREMVLTVARIEATALEDGRKAVDLIVRAVHEDRRESLRRKGSTRALESLTWLELINMIGRNWQFFGPYFGSKRDLDLHADIVNDRHDAHAKSMDVADLALQRRSITWFRSSMERCDLL